jgi:hypothetical protein
MMQHDDDAADDDDDDVFVLLEASCYGYRPSEWWQSLSQ